MPIKTTYTNEWGENFPEAVAAIKTVLFNFDANNITVVVAIWGTEAEFMNADLPPRATEEFVVGRNELGTDLKTAGKSMKNELEKVIQTLAKPGSVKVASMLDYTSGTIIDADNTQ